MKPSLIGLSLAILPLHAAPVAPTATATQATPQKNLEISNHQRYSSALVDLLKKTLSSLTACQDPASTKQQLATLQQYQLEMEQLALSLERLPNPSAADYVQAEQYLIEFNRTWRLITEEIKRLHQQQLLTAELKEILKVQL